MKRYIRASFDNWIPDWLAKDSKALNALNSAGIDLKKAAFDPAPNGRGKDYPVYLIDDGYRGTVWIPGIYNDGHYITDPSDKNYKAIKYVAKKNLPILETYYLSKADYLKEKKDRYVDPRYAKGKYDKHAKYQGQYFQEPSKWDIERGDTEGKWIDSTEPSRFRRGIQRDKSGYIIPNPEKRLLDFYASDAGSKKLGERIEKVYNDLKALKEDIFNIDFSNFGKWNGEADYSSTAYQNILSAFGNACRNYRLALNYLDKDSWVGGGYAVSQAFREVRDIEDTIARIKEAIKKEYY